MFLKKSAALAENKFHIIPNGFDEDDFQKEENRPEELFLITYVGSIADNYNPELFFNVLDQVRKNFPEIKFRLRFVGSMPASIKNLVNSNRLEEITEYISNVSHEQAIRYMQSSTLLLLLIPEVPNNEGILTGKLFEYLASRRLIIGLGPKNGKASNIIDECESGKMFERDEKDELGTYFKEMILRWKEKKELLNFNITYSKYSRKEQAKMLSSIILENHSKAKY